MNKRNKSFKKSKKDVLGLKKEKKGFPTLPVGRIRSIVGTIPALN